MVRKFTNRDRRRFTAGPRLNPVADPIDNCRMFARWARTLPGVWRCHPWQPFNRKPSGEHPVRAYLDLGPGGFWNRPDNHPSGGTSYLRFDTSPPQLIHHPPPDWPAEGTPDYPWGPAVAAIRQWISEQVSDAELIPKN